MAERTLRVFIPVFFRAPMGGLQEHVRQIVKALAAAGHEAVVMCPPGPFAEQLRGLPATKVLTTDFEDLSFDMDAALALGPYQLVHAQPFQSRPVGLALARLARVPALVTFHRIYLDDVARWKDEAQLLAVCPAIRDHLIVSGGVDPARVSVLPNGTELGRFSTNEARSLSAEPTALFVGRLDPDKQLAIDVLVDAWEHQSRGVGPTLRWKIAGQGSLEDDLRSKAERLGIEVEFCGWVDQVQLAALYKEASVAMGPGRCALDGMTAGTPTIGVGLLGYLGLIHGESTVRAFHGNFGESAAEPSEYQAGQLSAELDWLFARDTRWQAVSKASATWAASTMDQRILDQQLLALYEQLSKSESTPLVFSDLRVESRWHYWSEGGLAPHYQCPQPAALTSLGDSSESIQIESETSDVFYLSSRGGGFEHPGKDQERWALPADTAHKIALSFEVLGGSPTVELWIIEYDETQRLLHTRRALRTGQQVVTWRTSTKMSSIRIAIRFLGPGRVCLGPLSLAHEDYE